MTSLNWHQPLVPWLSWACIELFRGVKEIPGVKSHPRILDYHANTSLKSTSDEVPWCSAFMCSAMTEVGLPSTNSAAARSWLGWGVELKDFRLGCICVFWRVSPHSWEGHVGIGVRAEGNSIWILGGNQGNEVSVRRYPKEQLLSMRWPDPDDFQYDNYYQIKAH